MSRLPAALLVGFMLVASDARAASFVFTDFSDVSALQLNGNAAQVGNVLRVTPEAFFQSGSAFMSSAVALGASYSFSTFFSFRISSPSFGDGDGDGLGADGLTFIIQTNSNTAGAAGGGLGYQGIPNSVAVEYDTYFNSGIDPNGNHVGIDLGGNIVSVLNSTVATRLNNGQIWYSWIDYDGVADQIEVRLNTVNVRPVGAIMILGLDLAAQIGSANAFVGFGSGTGAGVGNHDILSWEFRDEFAPVGVPEPGSLALVGLGLAVAARRLRRSRPL
jgi:hypothetical protein